MIHIHSRTLSSPLNHEHRRVSGAVVCSVAIHVLALVVLSWLAYGRNSATAELRESLHVPQRIVWVAMQGPSGGGGGSKRRVPEPPRPVPPQATQASVPVPPPTEVPQDTLPPAPPTIEPQPLAFAEIADASTAGAAAPPAAALGEGPGRGSGSGAGDGAGPGTSNGFGGGAYRPGNGVTSPVPVRRASPLYTPEAMRARAQGVITVECVVEPNGECGEVRIVRSFTPPYGLDRQALDAARRWRFRPGTRDGEAVPVLVSLEIEFNVR
jgi:protein TonB